MKLTYISKEEFDFIKNDLKMWFLTVLEKESNTAFHFSCHLTQEDRGVIIDCANDFNNKEIINIDKRIFYLTKELTKEDIKSKYKNTNNYTNNTYTTSTTTSTTSTTSTTENKLYTLYTLYTLMKISICLNIVTLVTLVTFY